MTYEAAMSTGIESFQYSIDIYIYISFTVYAQQCQRSAAIFPHRRLQVCFESFERAAITQFTVR